MSLREPCYLQSAQLHAHGAVSNAPSTQDATIVAEAGDLPQCESGNMYDSPNRKPAPMDDDVRMLTVKCAEALGYKVVKGFENTDRFMVRPPFGGPINYRPAHDPAQAFELLCWLAERGTVTIDIPSRWFAFCRSDHLVADTSPCNTPAELRLALMRATVKVHEGRGK